MFKSLSDDAGTENEEWKCYRVLCLENNGHQSLKSDKINFRVNNTTIFERGANWGRKVKTQFSEVRPCDIMKIPRPGKFYVWAKRSPKSIV